MVAHGHAGLVVQGLFDGEGALQPALNLLQPAAILSHSAELVIGNGKAPLGLVGLAALEAGGDLAVDRFGLIEVMGTLGAMGLGSFYEQPEIVGRSLDLRHAHASFGAGDHPLGPMLRLGSEPGDCPIFIERLDDRLRFGKGGSFERRCQQCAKAGAQLDNLRQRKLRLAGANMLAQELGKCCRCFDERDERLLPLFGIGGSGLLPP